MQGDCLERMKEIPDGSVDMILTDPPYGTTKLKWDSVIPLDQMWKAIHPVVRPNTPILLFGSEPFSSNLRLSNVEDYKYDLYWKKEKPTNFFQLKRRFGKVTENVCVFYNKQCKFNPQKFKVDHRVSNSPKGKHSSVVAGNSSKRVTPYQDDGTRYPLDILEFNRVKLGSTIHPTQKPVELLEYLIKTYTDEGDTVLDFTMGSGSTGVACRNLGRKFIGIEMDEGYYNIAKERIKGTNRECDGLPEKDVLDWLK